MELAVGHSIKGYELRERLGAGGFGAVYRAQQSTVGREVAIKIILPHFASHPDFIRRFETEAHLVARLEHLHIVPLYDYWRDPDGAYLVMRWLKGGSLREVLLNGPLTLEMTAQLLAQITSALAAAHRSNVIHRDLKPGNILLDEDGNAYLADFGIAKDISLQGGITEVDAIVGSPDYLAPEQARSEPVTPRTDLYSLGVVLYEMLTGQHPFPNLNSIERLYKHLNDPLPEITTLPAETSAGINAVIQKATAKDPQQRYADALEVASAFHQAARTSATSLVETLTQREQTILQLIIEGRSNKEIAQQLYITLMTVKWYITQIYRKLGVRSRVQAIVRARELHLIGGTTASADGAASVVIPTDEFQPDNPYKGLRAFQAADHADFFGREKLVGKLVRRLSEAGETERFLAVVGPSGSGKSSLVKAGLIPALWRGEVPGSEKWFVVEMLPGAHPLEELEIALTRVAANQVTNLNEHLRRDERGLLRVASLILPNDGSDLMLVIDQFEEVFTLVEDEAARVHFLDLLYTAVSDPRSRVRIVLTLRADYYDRPLHYPQFGDLLRSRMETILPLSAEELERAIARPAERTGARFEEGLVASIVSEVNYQAGALPLLQYALTELFENRRGRLLTHEAYQAIGKAVGALAKRADELYLSLDERGQSIAQQIFLRLVTLGEGAEDTRRRAPRSELLALVAEPELAEEIIDTYAEYRLLTLDNDPGTRTPTVELAHEAIIREWERLKEWLNESRGEIRLQRQLASAAQDWHDSKADPSFLLRGGRLETFEAWAAETTLALTPRERKYLQASLDLRQREQVAEAERQAREVRLERRSVTFLRVLVAVLVIGALISIGFAVLANQRGNEAVAARREAEREAEVAQSIALGANARLQFEGDPLIAIPLAIAANSISNPPPFAQHALADVSYAPQAVLRRFEGHSTSVYAVAYSPDGNFILSGDDIGDIILWNAHTGQRIRTFEGHSSRVNAIKFSPDGHRAVSTGADAHIYVWDVATGDIVHTLSDHVGCGCDIDFSPDGSKLLSMAEDATLILWDIQTGEAIRHFEGHTNSVMGAAFSPDGLTVLSASDDTTLILWDVETGTPIRTFRGHTDYVVTVEFTPDGLRALSGAEDGSLILWDVQTGELIRTMISPGDPIINRIVISPDGQTALSVAQDSVPLLWDIETGMVIRELQGHTAAVSDIAFSTDGTTAVSGAHDNEIILWNIADQDSGAMVATFNDHTDGVSFVDYAPDGQSVISSSRDGTVRLWDVDESSPSFGQVIHIMNEDQGEVWAVRFSPDGRTAISLPVNGAPTFWDMATGQSIRRFFGSAVWQGAVDFLPDGQFVALGEAEFNDSRVVIFNVTSGQPVGYLVGHTSWIDSLAVSRDGRRALSGADDQRAIFWNLETGEALIELRGHSALLRGVALSPDGQLALTASNDGSMLLWDVDEASPTFGQSLRAFTGHRASVLEVAFSPDGRLAVSGSRDQNIIVWDVATGQPIRTYSGHTATVRGVRFSPDGTRIVSGADDGTVRLWRVDTLDQLIRWTYDNRLVRELTCSERSNYNVSPFCESDGSFATSTPYPTNYPPSIVPITPTPVPEIQSLSWALTVTPVLAQTAHVGSNRGEIEAGSFRLWQFEGNAGDVVTISVEADAPVNDALEDFEAILEGGLLDVGVRLRRPSDLVLVENDDTETSTNSRIDSFTLPEDGTYTIEVYAWPGPDFTIIGGYTLNLGLEPAQQP
jgi:WD40 repeat protein/serine/threonine protein kinase